MANCPNCNAPLPDDAKFCDNCGAPIVREEAPAPAPVPETAPGTAAADVNVNETVDAAPAAPAGETMVCPSCGGVTSAEYAFCEHCGASLHAGGTDASAAPERKKSGFQLKKWMIYAGIAVVAVAVVVVLIVLLSGGGGKGYGVYVKDKELFYSNLSRNGAEQVTANLAGDLDADNGTLASYGSRLGYACVLSRDGKLLFFPDKLSGISSFTLYYRSVGQSGKDAVKIDSDVTRYAVSDNAALVTYMKNGNLYQYNMSRDEKEKLDGDIRTFFVSPDGKKIVYYDSDNTLYQLDSGKEKQKLDSNIDSIYSVSEDCKTLVYMKNDTLYLKQDGKDKAKIASDVSVIHAYDTGAVYYTETGDGETVLYYFDGRDSTELTDEYHSYASYSSYTPVLVYSDEDDYYVAVGAKVSDLGAESPERFSFREDGSGFWYLDEVSSRGEGDLYEVKISGGAAQKASQYDTDVYSGYLAGADGHVVYFKDVSSSEGELYYDGSKADDDVYTSGVRKSDSGAVLYFTDYNSSKSNGTLKQYSGGKPTKVSDDVFQAVYTPTGSILYLADYSASRYRGDLYVYSGSNSQKLDDDVTVILSVGAVGDVRYRGAY